MKEVIQAEFAFGAATLSDRIQPSPVGQILHYFVIRQNTLMSQHSESASSTEVGKGGRTLSCKCHPAQCIRFSSVLVQFLHCCTITDATAGEIYQC